MSALPDLMRRMRRKLDIQRGLSLSYDDLAMFVATGAYAKLQEAAEDEAAAEDRPRIPLGDGDVLVYFIQSGSDGPIKIGRTRNVPQRRQHLQLATCHPLRVLASVKAPHWAEQALHNFYRREHIRGEWYRPSPRLLAYIAELAA